MAIQKQFVLRYREEGHIRFEIPAQFCEPSTAKALTAALLKLEGVYRVTLYASQKKLSIRYQETTCNFQTLAKSLYRIIADLEQKTPATKKEKAADKLPSIKAKLQNSGVGKWFNQKYTDTKETIEAAKILTKVGMKQQKSLLNNPEKAMIDFFNDMLVIFLIKLHWGHITKAWIPNPLKYRYEWLAVFYMFFLLMRSRNPKQPK